MFARRIASAVLLAVGAFLLIGALFDLGGDLRHTIPSDHAATYQALTGTTWQLSGGAAHSAARYVTRVEAAYAVYELLFAGAFLILAAVVIRKVERWAWWGCWLALGEFTGFGLLFGTGDSGNVIAAAVAAGLTATALIVLRPRTAVAEL